LKTGVSGCENARKSAFTTLAGHHQLLDLPSYSPNLNQIERLWKFVKKEVLNSRHHQDFKRFQEAIDGCLNDLPTKHRDKLATLMTHNFQTWDDVSLLNA